MNHFIIKLYYIDLIYFSLPVMDIIHIDAFCSVVYIDTRELSVRVRNINTWNNSGEIFVAWEYRNVP